jgi:hypothetical protein
MLVWIVLIAMVGVGLGWVKMRRRRKGGQFAQ